MPILNRFVFFLGITLGLIFNTSLSALDIDYSLIGKPVPAFELPAIQEKLDGKVIKLSDYRGKLVLINFWASWCGPCRAEIPTLVKIQKTYKERSFSVIGLAMESKEDANKFLQTQDVNYPNAYGAEAIREILKKVGNEDGILPFSILLSPKQEIMAIYPGIVSETKMQRVLGRLLDDF